MGPARIRRCVRQDDAADAARVSAVSATPQTEDSVVPAVSCVLPAHVSVRPALTRCLACRACLVVFAQLRGPVPSGGRRHRRGLCDQRARRGLRRRTGARHLRLSARQRSASLLRWVLLLQHCHELTASPALCCVQTSARLWALTRAARSLSTPSSAWKAKSRCAQSSKSIPAHHCVADPCGPTAGEGQHCQVRGWLRERPSRGRV